MIAQFLYNSIYNVVLISFLVFRKLIQVYKYKGALKNKIF